MRPLLSETRMTVPLSLHVNGRAVQAQVDPRTLLVQLLREQLQLTGTHVGCDTAQCGACTVHLNGHAVKACSTEHCTRCRPRSRSATACNAVSARRAW
jgi:aerobic-type carbon monoxide dehydrogenase small subunit (CoxS/CutS family)